MNALRWILTVSVPVAVGAAWFLTTPNGPSASPPNQTEQTDLTQTQALAKPSSPLAAPLHGDPLHGDPLHGDPLHGDPLPVAIAERSEFNFGVMDSLQSGSHAFTIRNAGTAPLKLYDAGTTCKCTVSDIPDEPIPPGGRATVKMKWLTTSASRYYSQSAHLATNDPANRAVTLRVFGTIRNRVVVEPNAIVFSKVEPDSKASSEVLVFSELWSRFTIQDVQCSLPEFTWDVTKVNTNSESKFDQRTCYRIRMTCPDNLPQGHFSGVLRFRVVPAGPDPQPQACELAINGKVMRRLSVYGQAINADGEVNLGSIAKGQGREVVLLMKVRDTERSIPIERIEVKPAFVQVRVEADPNAKPDLGIYRLFVQIPKDAPECNKSGQQHGSLKLVIQHPRIQELALKLKFSVVGNLQANNP